MRRCLLIALCLGCGSGPGPRYPSVIDESSGLVASRTHPDIFWTHNDSGDRSRIFAVRADGTLLREVWIKGALNVDWEDITADDAGNLYVGDIGNNRSNRKDLRVYRLAEPDPRSPARASVDRVIPFHYPEQTGWPDPSRNFDAEALFWARGHLYLLTKHRSDDSTVLYRFESLEGGPSTPLARVGRFAVGGDPQRFGGRVTAADASADGRHLAVLSYHALFIFERPATGDDYLAGSVTRVPLNQDVLRQCEAVAWDRDAVIITNEDGRIFRLPRPWAWPGGTFSGAAR